ncbi:MAG: hypothetical protein PHD83_01890 [Caldisericia bacterium]|nr:hypothetical protein [Caldisericia bacterium]
MNNLQAVYNRKTIRLIMAEMVLSYSDAAFIATSSFPVNSQSIYPFITLQSDCFLPANTFLSLYINRKKLELSLSDTPTEELSLIPLKARVIEVYTRYLKPILVTSVDLMKKKIFLKNEELHEKNSGLNEID